MEKIFQIFKNHTDGILIINEKGKIIFWNNSLEKITGISTESAKSLNIWELQTLLLRETYSDEQIESTKGLWLSGKIKEVADIMSKQRTEFLFTKKNGANNTSSVPIEQHLYSFTSEGEDFYVVSIQDISERKKAEDAIKNAYAVNEHDLRSPFNAILVFSDPDFV